MNWIYYILQGYKLLELLFPDSFGPAKCLGDRAVVGSRQIPCRVNRGCKRLKVTLNMALKSLKGDFIVFS